MKTAALISAACLILATGAAAGPSPREEAELKDKSEFIVAGLVTRVDSEVVDSKADTDFGFRKDTDRIYRIRIRITEVKKGEGIEEGDSITVSAWQPERRSLRTPPDHKGHDSIPTRGNRVTVYLSGAGEDGEFEAIPPNGIRTLD